MKRLGFIAFLAALSACGGGGGVVPETSSPPQAMIQVDGYPATIKEYTLPGGQTAPGSMTVGPDGAVWFPVKSAVDSITSSGTITPFTESSLPNMLPGIASQNGQLWTSASNSLNATQAITSLTPAGQFSFIPFYSNDSGLVDPPAGFSSYNGTVYFAFQGDTLDGIGYISDGSSTYKLFNLTQNGSFYLHYLTVGPDHAVYATAPCCTGSQPGGSDDIIRCDPTTLACTYTTITPIGATPRDPQGITTGPDGNLWIAESGTNAIAKVSTNLTILAEYPIPTPNSKPTEIITAHDGTLWFTELAGNKIGRITTAGVISEYTVPTASSGPNGITTCPDACIGAHGRIWFAEFNANKVGELFY